MTDIVKPYDPKVLAEKLKAHGLEVGEEAVKVIFEETFAWVEASAAASATPIDDLIVGLVKPAKPYVLAQIDKINPAG